MVEKTVAEEVYVAKCRICGKKITAATSSAARFLLVQHMITHEKFLERVLKLVDEVE